MFVPRRGKASINPGGSPQFQALYIGHTNSDRALGRGCTTPMVQRMWDQSRGERYLPRVTLTLSPSGLVLKDVEKPKAAVVKFAIQDISYCSAESGGVHDRVFAWICQTDTDQSSSEHKLQCHAVLCTSKEKAQTISLVLSRAFQIAYRDWKTEKEKRERIKATYQKHQQFDQSATQLKKQQHLPNGLMNPSENDSLVESPQSDTPSGGQKLESAEEDGLSLAADKTTKGNSPMYEFNFEHKEMLDSLNSIPPTAEESSEGDLITSAAMSQMNIVEEDQLSFTDNSLVCETVSQKL